MSLQSTKGSWQ